MLRIAPDEIFEVTNGCGFAVTAISSGTPGEYRQISAREETQPRRIHLIQSLAKNDRDELAIQAATELGVTEFTPLQAERSVVRWNQEKRERNRQRWQQIAIEAMKQSGRCWVPQVNELQSAAEVVGPGLLLDAAGEPLSIQHLSSDKISLAVGPEGGFSDAEIEQLKLQSFIPVSISSGVLRTSTAGPAAAAIISALIARA